VRGRRVARHTCCGVHARSWMAQYRAVVTNLHKATCGRHVTHSVPPAVGVWPAVRLLGTSGAVPDASGCPSEPN
jgi:hypothetical protein